MKDFKGIKIGDITAMLSSSGIIVSKTGNPNHLTVCFNGRLNALDVHITNQKTSEKQDGVSIPIFDLEKFLSENEIKMASTLIPIFLKSLKRVKPGWLRHHGFCLVTIKETEFKDILFANSPRKKRKIEPNFKSIANDIVSKSDRWVFHPSYLHVLANDNFGGIVYAVGFRKSNRNKKLILFRLNIKGDFGWYAISEGQMINIMNIIKNYFANVFNNKAMEALRKRIDREFDLKL